ncbi:MAG: sigma-70 family RNA polymerase sigma factor [Candidatus Uhrbacteria bacterium]|nr:sigma-70 family RNA polymerase sigma factor [Patescibacteria group bacterium]MBU1907340.1 sigma-70 family RNA polymerase sigma factor [Patescibacteria group bacterium]
MNLSQPYQNMLRAYPVLTPEEELALAREYRASGSPNARERLVLCNLRAVIKTAKQMQINGLEIADLIQEGLLGLNRAVDTYDPERGLRFLTYANWWVKSYINRFVEHNLTVVRYGTTETRRRAQRGIRKALREIEVRLPGLNEEKKFELAAELLDITAEEAEDAYRNLAGQVSIEAPALPGSDHTRGETMGETATNDKMDRVLVNHEYRALILEAMTGLTERERLIIAERWLSHNPATLGELGGILELTRERVRQIEFKAKQKLKLALQDKLQLSDII